jgi:hypothetical protein
MSSQPSTLEEPTQDAKPWQPSPTNDSCFGFLWREKTDQPGPLVPVPQPLKS